MKENLEKNEALEKNAPETLEKKSKRGRPKKAKRGRPKKLEKVISARVSPNVYSAWGTLAKNKNMSISECLRDAAMESQLQNERMSLNDYLGLATPPQKETITIKITRGQKEVTIEL